MNRYEHYKVLVSDYLPSFLEKANNMIADGWIPAGGVHYDGHNHRQAMWKPPFPEEIKIKMDKIAAQEGINK